MTDLLRPIYCLADSQLLFWRPEGAREPYLTRLAADLPADRPVRAAYVGASNGDDPAFYSIFTAAMDGLGIGERRMVLSSFPSEDRDWLQSADLIVLAGGDPLQGWRIFTQSGMDEILRERHFAGAVLLGVSAGAVQLGWLIDPARSAADEAPTDGSPPPERTPAEELVTALRLVPAVVGVHEEADDWTPLKRLVTTSGLEVRGLGIPSGGGLAYHPDRTVEPLRLPVQELAFHEGESRLHQSLLMPREIPCHEDAAADTER